MLLATAFGGTPPTSNRSRKETPRSEIKARTPCWIGISTASRKIAHKACRFFSASVWPTMTPAVSTSTAGRDWFSDCGWRLLCVSYAHRPPVQYHRHGTGRLPIQRLQENGIAPGDHHCCHRHSADSIFLASVRHSL